MEKQSFSKHLEFYLVKITARRSGYRAKKQTGNGKLIITPAKLLDSEKCVHNSINFIISIETFLIIKVFFLFI